MKVITAQLDEIADDIEKYNPIIAFALDKISDALEAFDAGFDPVKFKALADKILRRDISPDAKKRFEELMQAVIEYHKKTKVPSTKLSVDLESIKEKIKDFLKKITDKKTQEELSSLFYGALGIKPAD